MADIKQLMSMQDLDDMLAESNQRPVLVMKHSTACPVSAAAYRVWTEFVASADAQKVALVWVRVIQERPVSLALAERVGVKHESPQAILIKNGKGVWNESHRGITPAALQAAVTQA